MKLKLLDLTLCRTPAFSPEDNLLEKWEELKDMIRDSSPSFYQIIDQLRSAELKNVNEKIRFSIWKYFNRARYRATPFGSFAAFTIIPLSTNDALPLILSHKIISNQFIDWKEKDSYTTDIPKLVASSTFFLTNSSIYSVGQEHRYIRLKNGFFEVASVIGFPELNAILSFCKDKTCKEKVYRLMNTDFQMQMSEVEELIEQMLGLQLLITERYPNITGEDYFKRLKVENAMPATSNYIISERKLISGKMNGRKFQEIPDVITFLSKYLPDTTNSTLSTFRNEFLKKFEQKAIPLAVAIDPELGISYGNLGHIEIDHKLADILDATDQKNQQELQISYTRLHRFLLDNLMQGGVVRLEEFENTKAVSSMPLPNTLSVLFHFWKGHPVIENTGGCTANALLGRFTIASQDLEKFGHEIAAIEEQANPDILFFDIAYQAEKQVDNVNRRKQLYKNELPILTWSCDPSPIHFDDILVAVRNTEIILWSKKHRKRMVPRIPSAYNYTRSDLAMYRFLCDLQHQHIKSDLNFKIQGFFPNLASYPRIRYKNVIISPAMWQVPEEFLRTDKNESQEERKLKLIKWLHKEDINFLFKAGNSDQTLCFDPNINEDRDAFLLYCRQNTQRNIYISEALISEEDSIKDGNGKNYAAQIIAHYSHSGTVYQSYDALSYSKEKNQQVNNTIFPGGEWLYFEIYCHLSRSNDLLLNQLSFFLKDVKSYIKKWFFIRYDDPKPHIRLRLQLKETPKAYLLISKLKLLLEQECLNGLISDIQIKTYFRETERYGANRMNLVEKLFSIDSKYVLYLLSKEKSTDQLYAITLTVMQKVIALCLNTINEQILFVKKMADQFSVELQLSPESFKKLNHHFQKLKENTNLDITASAQFSGSYIKTFSQIFSTCTSDTELTKMLADLLHMHINRLFHSDQRSHEAILYHYLLKVMLARRALLTVPLE